MIYEVLNDHFICKRLPPCGKTSCSPFMFHYADGGSYAEQTLRRNVSDLEDIALRQRVLKICRN